VEKYKTAPIKTQRYKWDSYRIRSCSYSLNTHSVIDIYDKDKNFRDLEILSVDGFEAHLAGFYTYHVVVPT
jgi:hypothetical protein